MRKLILLMAFSPLIFACGSGDTNKAEGENEPAKTEENQAAANEQAELDKGLEMIGALDCTTCHKISEKT